MATARVVLVEDHPLFSLGVKQMLRFEPDLEIVGSAKDYASAARVLQMVPADLLLTDLRLSTHNDDCQGIALAQLFRGINPRGKVLLISGILNGEVMGMVESIRPCTVISKAAVEPHELADVIRATLAGSELRVGIPEAIPLSTRLKDKIGKAYGLTPRQAEVAVLVARGWSNKKIADHLHIAQSTVRNTVSELLLRMHATNRTEVTKLVFIGEKVI